ncbi:hypothetical protein P7C70_g9057, partial [Phenoliferia sp. Uapishka_3]
MSAEDSIVSRMKGRKRSLEEEKESKSVSSPSDPALRSRPSSCMPRSSNESDLQDYLESKCQKLNKELLALLKESTTLEDGFDKPGFVYREVHGRVVADLVKKLKNVSEEYENTLSELGTLPAKKRVSVTFHFSWRSLVLIIRLKVPRWSKFSSSDNTGSQRKLRSSLFQP